MRILLPPSETKALGGEHPPINFERMPFAQLNPVRKRVMAALHSVSSDEALAAKVLKFNRPELKNNLKLESSATTPAAFRYTGVLYDALDAPSLDAKALAWLDENVLIQSSLFGLLTALTPIPWYRLSGNTRLPGLKLGEVWAEAHQALWSELANGAEAIIDLRSKVYQQLAPLPVTVDGYQVAVVDDSSGRALNHFNKKAKGVLVRVAAQHQASSPTELASAASAVGLKLREVGPRQLELQVPAGF